MRRSAVVVGVSAAMAGCGSTSRPATVVHQAATPAVSKTVPVYLPSECGNQVQRPSQFIIACGDGNSGVEHIIWHAWGSPVAWGTGFAFANDCEPNCVQGGVHHAPAEIYVRRPKQCGQHRQYTYAVIIVSESSYAERLTGAYNVACAGAKGGVSRTVPGKEESENVIAREAPSDKEVREDLQRARELEGK